MTIYDPSARLVSEETLATALDASTYWRGGTALATDADLSSLDPGVYQVSASSVATALGLPVAAPGVLTSARFGSQNLGIQTWEPTGLEVSAWRRNRNTAGWTPWVRVDAVQSMNMVSVPTGVSADTVTSSGAYSVLSSAAATTLGLPVAAPGTLIVLPVGTQVTQDFVSHTVPPQRWQRYKGSTSWSGLVRLATVSDVEQAIAAIRTARAGTGSGFRTVPLALTRGNSGGDAPTEATVRWPVNFSAPITRWRLHVSNHNPRYGTARGGVTITGVWLGADAGSGSFETGYGKVSDGGVVPADGGEWVSPWQSSPIGGGVDRLLSLAYVADAAPWLIQGGCWRSNQRSHGGLQAPALTRSQTSPLDVWIEAETWATTPVIAAAGDSLTVGQGATFPVHDSWLSTYCRAHNALPIHYAHSGDTMAASLDPSAYKWTQYAGTTPPDSLVWAIAGNDIFGGATLPDLKSLHASYATVLATVCPGGALYAATVLPRTATTGDMETVRRQYNAWLAQGPDGIRDLFDFAGAVSSDDETIQPAYDSGDGTHLTTTGYQALSEAIVRPISAPITT